MLLFGLVYFAQGLAGGLLTQPFTYYLKSLGMTADAVAAFFAVAAVPWMIKPLYGLITDLVPLFGYRRKSYLIVMAALAAAGFLSLTQPLAPEWLLWGLIGGTLGIAAVDVVADALMVEHGLRLGMVKQFQGQQWTWVNLAAVITALLGGWLSHTFAPWNAVATAASIAVAAPAAVVIAGWFLVHERKSSMDRGRMLDTARDVRAALCSRALWAVAGFLAFWNLIPNFGTPLYYHLTDQLRFDQYFIGQLISIGSVGAAVGAYVYRRCLAERFSTRQLLSLSIVLSVGMALGYLSLIDGGSAVVLYFSSGVVSMISLLTLFSLAASVCPPRAAGFMFAAFMALHSATTHVSAMTGAHLYERVFDHQIVPLVYLAAAVTATAAWWVPFLPGEPDVSYDLAPQHEYRA